MGMHLDALRLIHEARVDVHERREAGDEDGERHESRHHRGGEAERARHPHAQGHRGPQGEQDGEEGAHRAVEVERDPHDEESEEREVRGARPGSTRARSRPRGRARPLCGRAPRAPRHLAAARSTAGEAGPARARSPRKRDREPLKPVPKEPLPAEEGRAGRERTVGGGASRVRAEAGMRAPKDIQARVGNHPRNGAKRGLEGQGPFEHHGVPSDRRPPRGAAPEDAPGRSAARPGSRGSPDPGNQEPVDGPARWDARGQ